jgi:hypothetical protein
MAAHNPPQVRTYGNWRRPRSAGIHELGLVGTVSVLVGLVAVIFTMKMWGILPALALFVVVALMLALITVRDRHHRTLLQRATERIAWLRTRSHGAQLYCSGPLGRVPWGRFQLPGLAAQSELTQWQDSYGRPFALLHVPSKSHFTVVFAAEPDGAQLVDQPQVDLWVARWGQWLASIGDEPGVIAVSVTVETAPDSGARLQREVLGQLDPNAPPVARDMLTEVMNTYPSGSATVKAWLALTFSATTGVVARPRSAEEMARDLAARLPGLTNRLRGTGAGPARPMSAQQLCEVVRIAYEPRTALLIDEAYSAGAVPELSWEDVGPAAAQASWDSYRHDGAVSMSWSMTGAPRGEVQSSVLHQLLAPHHDIDRKRVSLLYRPLDSATAARTVERDKNNADFRVSGSKRPSARLLSEQKAVDLTAKEEARGAGLVDFGLVVTATVNDEERLPAARHAMDNLAATARVQLRPVYGAQDSAFAATLPLGLVLREHLHVPAVVRRAM